LRDPAQGEENKKPNHQKKKNNQDKAQLEDREARR
jgi:hypothetical protein